MTELTAGWDHPSPFTLALTPAAEPARSEIGFTSSPVTARAASLAMPAPVPAAPAPSASRVSMPDGLAAAASTGP